MRNKMHAMQQTNKKIILSQREQLKSSMQKTGMSMQLSQGGESVVLPQVEAIAAPRAFKNANLRTGGGGKRTSPGLKGVQ
jgi:hypothetical protein